MSELFAILVSAVEGSIVASIGAALVWGVLSVVLSPCHLAGIPLIVAFIGTRDNSSPMQAFALSTAFALGILVTLAGVGAATAAAGRMLGDLGRTGSLFVAVVFFAAGLSLTGILPQPLSTGDIKTTQKKGIASGFLLGLVFGIALGPCSFAFLAPVMGAAFKLAAGAPLHAAALFAAYGIGHCGVIALAGVSAGAVQQYLDWHAASRGGRYLRKTCGILVLLGGCYFVYIAW